jgi:peptide/nickel transport system permease protein
VVALTAPWLAPYDPVQADFGNRFAGSSFDHLLGTDNLGRDELSRLIHGARLSLGLALTATIGVSVVGLVLGVLAGTLGRAVDSTIMRIVDVLQALPALILALVVVGLLGEGITNLVLTIIAVGWPGYARVVRGVTLSVRENEFVEVARSLGASQLRIMARHITPNLIGPMIVLSTVGIGRTLLSVSALSFLGFGANVAAPDWGAMLAESRSFMDSAPGLLAYPGAAITLLVVACNIAGDGVRDALDIRFRDRLS